MRSFLPSGVPWGRPSVPGIPLPPFANHGTRQRFNRLLQLHVAMIDDGPSLATKILCAALAPRGPLPERLTALELEAAMTTFFPAPWTPTALAEAIGQVHRGAPRPLSDGRWDWDFDPIFTAIPRGYGGWVIERNERGSVSTQVLEADDDLVLLWMGYFRTSHPFPFGARVEEADGRLLAPAVHAAREVHEEDAALPYLANWRSGRGEFLEGPA